MTINARMPAVTGLRNLALALLMGTAATTAQAEPVTLTVALAANPQMETAAKATPKNW